MSNDSGSIVTIVVTYVISSKTYFLIMERDWIMKAADKKAADMNKIAYMQLTQLNIDSVGTCNM